MKLPNGERAVVELAKLRDYCLALDHLRGRHKARVFASALGLYRSDAPFLRSELLRAARTGEAKYVGTDRYGSRFQIDLELAFGDRRAFIRSLWIVLSAEVSPRFVTCYTMGAGQLSVQRSRTIKKLDVVALTRNKPKLRLLARQVGTVVERLDRNVFEVEFSDDRGRAYATTAVPASDLLVLRYRRARAA